MVPAHPLTRRLWLVAVLALAGATCAGDDPGDVASFCAAVEALEADDPFADLQIASPAEMRAAFDTLAAGVERIAASAPDEVRVQARNYRDTVDELIDQLRGAGYDPREVDGLAYRQAAADHEAAAVSVENAAASLCP